MINLQLSMWPSLAKEILEVCLIFPAWNSSVQGAIAATLEPWGHKPKGPNQHAKETESNEKKACVIDDKCPPTLEPLLLYILR